MNFDIPKELQDYLNELDLFIENTIKPLENKTTTYGFLITVGKTRVPTGNEVVSLTKSGKRCWLRPSAWPMMQATIVTRCPRNTVVRRAPISVWP